MSKKVFILGAGFNQFLKKNFNYSYVKLKIPDNFGLNHLEIPTNLAPPMTKNFFRYALIKQFSSMMTFYGVNDKVLNYIEKLFNRPPATLLTSDFDLELLFSFLESQISDAKNINDKAQLNYLEDIRLNLIIAIGDIFFDLEYQMPAEGRDLLMKFGNIIYQTKSDIITFNYDCLAEWAIEKMSGRRAFGKLEEGNTFFKWDRFSAYGIKFTKIKHRTGDSYYNGTGKRNMAKKFYEKYYNNSPEFRFIKLHGSYNWYKYSKFKRNINSNPPGIYKKLEISDEYIKIKKVPKSLEKEIICFNGDWEFGTLPTWSDCQPFLMLEPIIIPPILLKEPELRKDIFQQLWRLAKESLIKCEEVIFIGYSFPDTDFYSKKLFIEAFSENKNISVTIVNPDDCVENKFRELVNFQGKIKRYADSGEFIKNFKLYEEPCITT